MANKITFEEFPWLVSGCSLQDLYGNAIVFAQKKNKELCHRYLQALINFHINEGAKENIVILEKVMKENIGYWAGYYLPTDRENVLEYFDAHHPFLPLHCTSKEAFELGIKMSQLAEIEKQLKLEIKP